MDLSCWCTISDERHVPEGDFYEATLTTHSGNPLHLEPEFLDHLSELLMQRYEGRPGSRSISIPDFGTMTVNRMRTKEYYYRLFDTTKSSPSITQDFITVASEALGLWIELSLGSVLYAIGPSPHSNDPAFDVLSIVRNSNNLPRLRVVQVKATEGNLQSESNLAITKFQKLEGGLYDPELSNKLYLIENSHDKPQGIFIPDLIFEPRLYRVTVVHSLSPGPTTILTTYSLKVPGERERRSAYRIPAEVPLLWNLLGERVYDQLI